MTDQKIFISLSEGNKHLAIDGNLKLLKDLLDALNQSRGLEQCAFPPIQEADKISKTPPIQEGAH